MDAAPAFACPLGSEIELQIVNLKGEILRGEDLVSTWKHVFDGIEARFTRLLEELPADIKGKVTGVKQVTKPRQGKQLMYLEVTYATLGKSFHINVLGPDPNISQVTWIMELVTPPCTSMREFSWWGVLLNRLLASSLPGGKWVLPLGANPFEREYASGVTFGEHYHVGIDDPAVKLAAYTLIRNFIPQLVALTVNSPFMNGNPTGTVKVTREDGGTRVLGKDCLKSLRLTHNKAQLGPVDKETYIPCMDALDREAFCTATRRTAPDDRFVDVYPFTPYGTIEVRVFDTQFSLLRRLAIAGVLQAIVLKAKRLHEKKTRIPCVMPAVLAANREKAVSHGLHGKFQADPLLPKSFGMSYNEDPFTGKQHGKLYEAAAGMLFFLKGEIKDLGIEDVLTPFRLACGGNEHVKPPVAPADFLLHEFSQAGSSMPALVGRLLKRLHVDFCATDAVRIDDPVFEAFGMPASARPRETGAAAPPVTRAGTPATARTVRIDDATLDLPVEAITGQEAFPFTLRFTVNVDDDGSTQRDPVEIIVVQSLVEVLKRAEHVLATTITKLKCKPGEPVSLDRRAFPLVPPPALFMGRKRCRLRFAVKHGNEISIASDPFPLRVAPDIRITSDFEKRKRKVTPGEKHEVKYKISTADPGEGEPVAWPSMEATFQVTGVDSKQPLHEERRTISVKERDSISFKIEPREAWERERGIMLKLRVATGGKTIARHETGAIPVEPEPGKLPAPAPTLFHGAKPTPPATTRADPAPSTRDEYGLVKRLEFSSGNAPPRLTPATTPAPAARAAVARTLATTAPAVPKPAPAKAAIAPRAPERPPDRALLPARAVPARAKEEKQEMEKVAKLLDSGGKKTGDVKPLPLPFDVKQASTVERVTVQVIPRTPKILLPGEKQVATIEIARRANATGTLDLHVITTLRDASGTTTVVETTPVQVDGPGIQVQVEFDPGRAGFLTGDRYRVECLAFAGRDLAGRGAADGFEPARFTTKGQVSWKRVDLLCGTIFPEMDAGIAIQADVKRAIAPLPFKVEIGCQGVVMATGFTLRGAGKHDFVVPFRIDKQGLVTMQECPLVIRIFDKSGMLEREKKKIVSVIPRGPLFDIRDVRIDARKDLDAARLEFTLVNESKDKVSCTLDITGRDEAGRSHPVATRRVKLGPGEVKAAEIDRLAIPVAVLGDPVVLEFVMEIPEFNKITQAFRAVLPRASITGDDGPALSLAVKNLDGTNIIAPGTASVAVEIEAVKRARASNCKIALVEAIAGKDDKVLDQYKLPKEAGDTREVVYWKPPKPRNEPAWCELRLVAFQDGDPVPGAALASRPCTFLIHGDGT